MTSGSLNCIQILKMKALPKKESNFLSLCPSLNMPAINFYELRGKMKGASRFLISILKSRGIVGEEMGRHPSEPGAG